MKELDYLKMDGEMVIVEIIPNPRFDSEFSELLSRKQAAKQHCKNDKSRSKHLLREHIRHGLSVVLHNTCQELSHDGHIVNEITDKEILRHQLDY